MADHVDLQSKIQNKTWVTPWHSYRVGPAFPMCVRRQMSCSVLWYIAHLLFVTKLDMVGPQSSLTIVRVVLCALLRSQSIMCLLSFTSDCFTSSKVQDTLPYSLTFYNFNKLGTTAHIATIIWYTSCTCVSCCTAI